MNSDAREIFINNLKTIMQKKNITQTDIANNLNAPITTVSSWYHKKSYPRIERMQQLADYLNVSIRELTDDVNNAEDAIMSILKSDAIAKRCNYDKNKITDEDYIHFSNDVLEMIKVLSGKYEKTK